MSSENVNRTFIGTVVCVDLVGYSTKSTEQQTSIKQVFNRLLGQALRDVAEEDRIILDTGDGAAISFLGDPEASLEVAIAIQKSMIAKAADLGATPGARGEGPVRIGINLGPVRLAADMNGYPRIIGDGISVAEKIMSFALPGQLVASRSFHDMVSRVSDANASLFRYEGVRTDKNARDHEIYVVEPGAAKSAKAARAVASTAPVAATAAAGAPAREASQARQGGLAGFLRDHFKVGFAAVVLVAVIVAEVVLLAFKGPAQPASVAAAPAVQVPAAAPPATPPAVAPAVEVPAAKPAEKPVAKPAVETKPSTAEPARAIETRPPAAQPAAAPKPEPSPPKPAVPVAAEKAPAVPAKPAAAAAKPADPPRPASPETRPAKQPAEPKLAKAAPSDAAKSARKPEPVPAPAVEPPPPVAAPEPPREEPKPAPTATVTLVARAPVNFPLEAATRRIDKGAVNARLTLDANGAVKAVKILGSTSRFFEEESTRALKLYKFNPGLDGRTYDVEIAFQR